MTDWPQFRFASNHPGSRAVAANDPMTDQVSAGLTETLSKPTPGPVLAEPIVSGGRIYFGCADGYLYSVPTDWTPAMPDSSVYTWALRGGFKPPLIPAPAWDPAAVSPAVDGDIYAVAVWFSWLWPKAGWFTYLYAFKSNGQVKPKFGVRLGRSAPVGSPVLFDGLVYVACADGSIFRVDTQSGQLVPPTWKLPNTLLWSSPAVAPGPHGPTIFVGTKDETGELAQLQATDGPRIWKTDPDPSQTPMGDAVGSSPAVVRDDIYVGCEGPLDDPNDENSPRSARLYHFRMGDLPEQGGALPHDWSFPIAEHVTWSSPAVADGVVYIGANDNKVYAVNPDGSLYWQSPGAGSTTDKVVSSPTIVNGIVYVGCYDKNLYAFDASTGAKLKTHYLGQEVHSSASVVDGTVYIASGGPGDTTGMLHGFRVQ